MVAGAIAGGAAAGYWARSQPGNLALIEAIGGAIAGIPGGRLPDIIDPPSHPRHRSVGHGIAPCATALVWVIQKIPDAQQWLREQAALLREERSRRPKGTDKGLILIEILLTALSGALVGLAAGYLSHLVMDVGSPAGLPFVA